MKRDLLYKRCLTVGAIAAAVGSVNATDNRPNIILFMVDDMGWQDTEVPFGPDSTFQNRRYRTPNMSRLADMGVKFTEAYACAISSPSRCSLMSGMNAARHRVTNWTLEYDQQTDNSSSGLILPSWNFNGIQPDTVRSAHNTKNTTPITSLPKLLRENGYYTIHCGKAHFGARTTPGADPLTMGFDVNIAGGCMGGPGSYLGTHNFGEGSAMQVPGLEKYHGQDIFLTEALTIEALTALQKPIDEGKPFYLYMSHYAVHVPLDEDTRFSGNYRGVYDEQFGANLNTKEINYAALVEGMDKSLGDILDFLGERPEVAQNTIIIFMSDNGGLSYPGTRQGVADRDPNAPHRAGKGSAYLGGVHEPMMVYWPGVTQAGTVNDNRIMIEDFFPSILEMAGVSSYSTVQTVDGKSFVDVIKNPAAMRERTIIWHYPNLWDGPINMGDAYSAYSAIMKGDYHLIYLWETRERRLYNVREDIGEENDLALLMPEKVTELSRELTDSLKAYDAQRPSYPATGELAPWPDELPETPHIGEVLVNDGSYFRYSNDQEKFYYRIYNRQGENEDVRRTGYWMTGEHYGYKAVQMSSMRYAAGDRLYQQLFYFLPGSDDKHFRIMTYDGQNVDYVDGLTVADWGEGSPDEQAETVTDRYLQYGTPTSGEFSLYQVNSYDYCGIGWNNERLNDRGSEYGSQANMKWVINDNGDGNVALDNYGSQYAFEYYDPNGSVAVGNVATPHSGIFKFSTPERRYYYTITNAHPEAFFWTQGEHYDAPAIQCTTERLHDAESGKQLFYFTEGVNDKNFYIYTYNDVPLAYVSGTTVASWAEILKDEADRATTQGTYLQYGGEKGTLFQLVKSAKDDYYGLRVGAVLLNDRGTGNGEQANMQWVVNSYSGNSVSDLGSIHRFTFVREATVDHIRQVSQGAARRVTREELSRLGDEVSIYTLSGSLVKDVRRAESGIYVVQTKNEAYTVLLK